MWPLVRTNVLLFCPAAFLCSAHERTRVARVVGPRARLSAQRTRIFFGAHRLSLHGRGVWSVVIVRAVHSTTLSPIVYNSHHPPLI